MSKSEWFVQARRDYVIACLRQLGVVRTGWICEKFGVDKDTALKDIRAVVEGGDGEGAVWYDDHLRAWTTEDPREAQCLPTGGAGWESWGAERWVVRRLRDERGRPEEVERWWQDVGRAGRGRWVVGAGARSEWPGEWQARTAWARRGADWWGCEVVVERVG